jgi:hypothetical protein
VNAISWAFQSGSTDEPPFRVPFLFATNGRPYLKQVETQSGIWFRDARFVLPVPVAIALPRLTAEGGTILSGPRNRSLWCDRRFALHSIAASASAASVEL